MLLEAGADMAGKTSDEYGATPLHLAVSSDRTATVSYHHPFSDARPVNSMLRERNEQVLLWQYRW
jgi:hypothetical protein